MKILITDDDPVSREVLHKIVSSHGDHQVTVTNDGSTAWTLLNDPGRYFDVVFLDIAMPELNGLDLLTRIRETHSLASMEVVLCTGSKDRATIARAIQLGARHYLVKPLAEAVVVAKLDQFRPPDRARERRLAGIA